MTSPRYPGIRLLILASALVAPALPAAEPSPWSGEASLNLFLAGMSGDVAAKGVPADVDASFGDIFQNLDACLAGRFTAVHGRWVLSAEFSYLRLKATATRPATASVQFEQWLLEPTVGWRVGPSAQVFAGARYNGIDSEVRTNGPLALSAHGTQGWWDPIVGATFSLPLSGEKLTLDGRCDIGGFGAGSDLTWQVFPTLNWRFASWGSAQLGYRWLGTDYETGRGTSRFVYDVVAQGPQLGFSLHF
jgi:hypothetical protein